MPNWNTSCWKVTGEHEQVEKLYAIMQELEKMPDPGLFENGFGSTWLGNLVIKLGGDWNKIYCRGEWNYMSFQDGILTIDIESAWSDPNEVREFIEEKLPGIKIYFQSEEPGCVIYETNDPTGEYFPDRFYLWDEISLDTGYYQTLDSLLKAVEKITGSKHLTTFNAAEKAMESHSRKHNHSSYEIQEFKVVD